MLSVSCHILFDLFHKFKRTKIQSTRRTAIISTVCCLHASNHTRANTDAHTRTTNIIIFDVPNTHPQTAFPTHIDTQTECMTSISPNNGIIPAITPLVLPHCQTVRATSPLSFHAEVLDGRRRAELMSSPPYLKHPIYQTLTCLYHSRFSLLLHHQQLAFVGAEHFSSFCARLVACCCRTDRVTDTIDKLINIIQLLCQLSLCTELSILGQ